MPFWQSAEDQAGRNFGDRFWIMFTVAKVIGKIWPALVALAAGLTLILAYRLTAPDWGALGDVAGTWQSQTLLVTLASLLVAGLVAWAVVRHFTGPPRRRRRRFR